MDISEKLVTAMMRGKIDVDTGEQLLEIHTQVCSKIQCGCGKVMDTYKSALFRIKGKEEQGGAVCCGKCIDQALGNVPEENRALWLITDFRDYDSNFQLKKKNPPVKTPRAPKLANIRQANGELQEVTYSRRFTEHGFNWFLHRETRSDYWCLSNWETGYRAGTYRTQGECRERIKALIPEDINLIKGAVSLHGGANPPVKKETKPCLRSK